MDGREHEGINTREIERMLHKMDKEREKDMS